MSVCTPVVDPSYIDDKTRPRILERMRAIAAVSSPHLLPFTVVERDGGIYASCADLPPKKFSHETPSLERVREVAHAVVSALRALHEVGIAHRAVRADRVFIDEDKILLGEPEMMYLVRDMGSLTNAPDLFFFGTHCSPEEIMGKPVGSAADIYAVGAMMYEAIAREPLFEGEGIQLATNVLLEKQPLLPDGTPSDLAELVQFCLEREPENRPRAAALLVRLEGLSFGATAISYNPDERKLLADLRKDPRDAATRLVYADWLEENGHAERAELMRLEGAAADPDDFDLLQRLAALATKGDARWRSVVSRAAISKCGIAFEYQCPKRWDALTSTHRDGVRHCGQCNKDVFFVTSFDEARERGGRRECIAIDPALERDATMHAYNTPMWRSGPGGIPPQPRMGMMMVEPGPVYPPIPTGPGGMEPTVNPPPPRKPGVFEKIKGWFTK